MRGSAVTTEHPGPPEAPCLRCCSVARPSPVARPPRAPGLQSCRMPVAPWEAQPTVLTVPGLQASRSPAPDTCWIARRLRKQTRLPSRTVSGAAPSKGVLAPARKLLPSSGLQNDACLATVCSPEDHHHDSSPGPQCPVSQTWRRPEPVAVEEDGPARTAE